MELKVFQLANCYIFWWHWTYTCWFC